jgi:hypothetical protein
MVFGGSHDLLTHLVAAQGKSFLFTQILGRVIIEMSGLSAFI